MSPFVETTIIFGRELRKNFRSAKGIALAVLTLLGGAGMALLWAKIRAATEGAGGIPVEMLAAIYGMETAQWLKDAPLTLLALLNTTMMLSPLLVALMGFDSISADIQHRTVRYWTLRSRRPSYFIGKWAGLWATVAAVTFLMDLIIWIVTISTDKTTEGVVGTTLSWGFRFWVIAATLAAVWSAIAVFVSALFRTPMIALLVTMATFFTLWVASLIAAFAKVEALVYVNPNQLDHLLLVPNFTHFAGGILASLAMAVAYVVGGSLVFARRDV